MEVEIKDCYDAARSYTFFDVLFMPRCSVNLMNVSSAVARGSSFSSATDASHLLALDRGQLPVK